MNRSAQLSLAGTLTLTASLALTGSALAAGAPPHPPAPKPPQTLPPPFQNALQNLPPAVQNALQNLSSHTLVKPPPHNPTVGGQNTPPNVPPPKPFPPHDPPSQDGSSPQDTPQNPPQPNPLPPLNNLPPDAQNGLQHRPAGNVVPDGAKAMGRVFGMLSTVDGINQSITITPKSGNAVTLQVQDSTKIVINGKPASFGNLAPVAGDLCGALYDSSATPLVAKLVFVVTQAPPSPAGP